MIRKEESVDMFLSAPCDKFSSHFLFVFMVSSVGLSVSLSTLHLLGVI